MSVVVAAVGWLSGVTMPVGSGLTGMRGRNMAGLPTW